MSGVTVVAIVAAGLVLLAFAFVVADALRVISENMIRLVVLEQERLIEDRQAREQAFVSGPPNAGGRGGLTIDVTAGQPTSQDLRDKAAKLKEGARQRREADDELAQARRRKEDDKDDPA